LVAGQTFFVQLFGQGLVIAKDLVDLVEMKDVISLPEVYAIDLEVRKSSDTSISKLLSARLTCEKHIFEGLRRLAVLHRRIGPCTYRVEKPLSQRCVAFSKSLLMFPLETVM
jgi:hypothetical protein